MLYPDKVSIFGRSTASRDVNGLPVETEPDKHIRIHAMLQFNRSTTGSNNNRHADRGVIEQPGTSRVYTDIDVADVEPDDILVHHHPTQNDVRYIVLRAVDEGGRGKHWRIEVSTL